MNVDIKLVRHAYLPECTLGRLYVGDLVLATLEEPWSHDPDGPGGQKREPGKRESCVPDGIYDLVPHNGTTHKDVWALVRPTFGVYRQPGDIPLGAKYGRSAILIHSGNHVGHIEGCILVGLAHGRIDGVDWVFESRKALEHLRIKLGTQPHRILIRPVTGTAELT